MASTSSSAKFRCTFCGSIFTDRESWDHHMDTCFSRTTICSLCGVRMPTAHKQEHLRVIHGLVSHHQSSSHHEKSGSDRRALRNSEDPRVAKTAKKMQMLNEHADVFPVSNLADRPIAKSSTLSKMVSAAASTSSFVNNNSTHNYSNGQKSRSRSASPSISTINNTSSRNPHSSTSAGFSFKSNDDMLNEASSSQRMKMLLEGEYNSIPKLMVPESEGQRHQTNSHQEIQRQPQKVYHESRNPLVMNNFHNQQEQRSKSDQQYWRSASTASSSPTNYVNNKNSGTPKFDFKTQQRLAIVENVVHNIMTRSPARDSMVEENSNNLKLLSHAANYETAQYSKLTPYTERKGQQNITSLQYHSTSTNHHHQKPESTSTKNNNMTMMTINNDMNACPDCGKVILSLERHRCDAESTKCPKCGEIVSLLSFDRHFLDCAIGATQWSNIREKKEMERLMVQNAASFRKSRSSVGLMTSTTSIGGSFKKLPASQNNNGKNQSATMMTGFGDIHESDSDDNDIRDDDNNNGKTDSENTKSMMNSGSGRILAKAASSFRQEPPPAAKKIMSMKNKHADLHLSVDEGIFASEVPMKTSLDLFREAKQGKLSVDDDNDSNNQQRNNNINNNSKSKPGFRNCVLCNELIPESQLSTHLETCNQNLLSCPLCKQGVPAHAVDDHKLVCEANRRRCPFCSTSIQFSRLPDHVSKCCESQGSLGNGKMTMYHGTSEKSAKTIIQDGFLPSQTGLLGEGVYMTRDMAKAKNYGPVILEALVTVPGKILTVSKIGHRMQKSWQVNGYDAAWLPQGVSKSGMEEHCIKNPQHIAVVKVIR